MVMIPKLRKDGTVKVPHPLLKQAGLRPGVGLMIHVSHKSLIIEGAGSARALKTKPSFKTLRGSLNHIDWKTTHRDVRERWDAWRDRLSA